MEKFDIITLASLALISFGACIMFTNILLFRRLMRKLKHLDSTSYSDIRIFSLPPLVFMIFFLMGYLFVLYGIFHSISLASTLLVAIIFFFGAVFVFITTRFQSRTIKHLTASHERLEHESLHDKLTGLSNRNLIRDRLQQAIDISNREPGVFYAVLSLDVDRFKSINDSLGHAVGDGVLLEVARRLLSCVRNVDTVSRFSSDEFVILLNNTNPRRTIKVVKRIRKKLAKPFLIEHHTLNVTVGIGIYYGPTSEDLPDLVLQNAHLALHRAKRKGRGRFKVFRSAMLDRAVRTMALEHDLLRGIRKGEFEAHFQPVVSLNEPPVLLGFEALARWNHPTKGLVSPLVFIPMAEETGIISDVGKEIYTQACEMKCELSRSIPDAGNIRMAVNLSVIQLRQSFFARQLLDITEKCGVSPSDMSLEVTESTVMDESETTINRLAQLRAKGFSVAIDDFGTGYSSFAYLKDLPATHIKIDQAFIRGMLTSQSDREIIRSMIAMGHSLFMTVVAEGIENKEQLDMLRDFGCDCVQGFYYSRPLPPDQVADFVRDFLAKHPQDLD